MADSTLAGILAGIIRENAAVIASAIDEWGAGSSEVDEILRECLAAAAVDYRMRKKAA